MASLIVWRNGQVTHVRNLETESFTIGRAVNCDMVIDDMYVSREHARLELRDGQYYLVNRSKVNDTVLNDVSIDSVPTKLKHGDVIVIDKTVLCFLNPDQLNLASIKPAPKVKLPEPKINPTDTRKMVSIFVSHSRDDDQFVNRLTMALYSRMYLSLWVDHQSIAVGRDWETEVQNGLDRANSMVVVLSKAAIASHNVRVEWNFFLEKKKPIFPILAEPVEIPFRLRLHQILDFSKSFDDGLHKLSEVIQNEIKNSQLL